MPLIEIGAPAQFVFDGWPTMVFSGWPQMSYGTFPWGNIRRRQRVASERDLPGAGTNAAPIRKTWPKQLKIGVGATGVHVA